MHQGALDKDECALFEFPRLGQHTFWNKNVDFPISLIFCDSKFAVKDVKYLSAHQTKSVGPSSYDIKYVIEAHIDAPMDHKVRKGTRVSFDGEKIKFNG